MIPVLDATQAAGWDETARLQANIPSRVLMETAGRAVATVMAVELEEPLRHGAMLVAGHGNNGGDGWVAARALRAAGVEVWATDEERERSPDCAANRGLALDEGVQLVPAGQPWPQAGVLVDALLGTGASGPPRGAIAELVERLRERRTTPVVAVDGPTGLDLSTGESHDPVPCAVTVTFGGMRRGHLMQRTVCGKIVVVDIGFPPADPAWPRLVDDRWAKAMVPPFRADMHKGSRGRVLVVGGAKGMAGAAIHAASAALVAGAGIAKIAAESVTVAAAQQLLPDALTLTTALGPDLEPDLVEGLSWADAVVLGPGLGRGDERTAFVQHVLEATNRPVVIDADALHAGLDSLVVGAAARVLTPHPGEFRSVFPDLTEQLAADRFGAASAAASAARVPVLLLKGVPTIVAAPGHTSRVVAAGNPSLATGGSGDVLSGLIAAFLARDMSPMDAASLGAHVMGRAAEIATVDHTVRAARPADVIAAVPKLWQTLSEPTSHRPPVMLELHPPTVA